MEVEGHNVQALIDNGAEFSAISLKVYETLVNGKGFLIEKGKDGVAVDHGKTKVLFKHWCLGNM